MNSVIIILVLFICIFALAFVYEINIKKIKQFGLMEEEKLNKITNKYPSNLEVCKELLKKLKNDSVIIEENNNYQNCMYIAISNKIIIADVKNSYTRIQTIAHECLHSVQSRRILLFHFILSNIYLFYFLVVGILGLCNILQNTYLYITIMVILSYILYFVRSYLENDAMIKARYLAQEYLQEKQVASKEEIITILDSYDNLNYIGIKTTNFMIMLETLIKIIIIVAVFII